MIFDPKTRAWLAKHGISGEDEELGDLLLDLLEKDDLSPRVVKDIFPVRYQGQSVFILARVIRNQDMSVGHVREREKDREAKELLLEHSGLKSEDLKWVTYGRRYW